MACKICGRNTCAPSFHPLDEQIEIQEIKEEG